MDFTAISTFVAAHGPAAGHAAIGFGLGIVLSNPGTAAVLAFKGFVKLPGVGPWIAANPDKAKAWADQFDQAIDKAIDAYAKAPPAAAAPAVGVQMPPPPPPPEK